MVNGKPARFFDEVYAMVGRIPAGKVTTYGHGEGVEFLTGPCMRSLGPPAGSPLFVYGTLRDPEFVSRLLERKVAIEEARLLDFELLRLDGLEYPTVFEAPGEVVAGGLYHRLTGEDYERLDAYEGAFEGLYVRIEARVVAGKPGSGGDPEPAFVYVVTDKTLRRYGAL